MPRSNHIILCCDCEGTEDQIRRIQGAIDGEGVPASWFFVGDTVREFPALVREIAATHQVESHTNTHPNLRRLSKEQQREEILGGKRAVEDCIGRATTGFRAPMHCINRDTVDILNEESFVFDASRLYFRYDMRNVVEVSPTWFREWMPLYDAIHLPPRAGFGIFRWLSRLFDPAVLPVHPHYAGKSPELAAAFRDFIHESREAGATFWSVNQYLAACKAAVQPSSQETVAT